MALILIPLTVAVLSGCNERPRDERVTVPDVVGLRFSAANKKLGNNGVHMRIPIPSQRGHGTAIVWNQMPERGDRVPFDGNVWVIAEPE